MPDVSGASPLLSQRYRLVAIIAAGGMATVYKAQDTLLNRIVAIKTLRDELAADPQFMQRFREEAQSAANLNHPNIVTVYDVGKDGLNGQERQYIVMEYVAGHDLKHIMRERTATEQPFTIDESLELARQVCEGVGAAHRRGLAHCDIKPQNIIVTPEGTVKVTDFGIARAFTSLLAERTDTVWGTPQYYAPEQASGQPPTAASDVYSIGVVLFELLAGRLPFESKDARELARMHLSAEPPELHRLNPNVSLQLESIVRRALSKDPQNRYRDAAQFGRILGAYLDQGREMTMGRTIPAIPPSAQTSGGPRAGATDATRPAMGADPRPSPIGSPGASQPQRAVTARSDAATSAIPAAQGAPERGGTDILLWLIASVAALCVLGLIPLYVFVYRAYSQPPGSVPTSGPVSTLNGGVATGGPVPKNAAVVPQLVAVTLDEAQRRALAAGLQVNVVAETLDGTVTQTLVSDQRPISGSQLALGSIVDVFLKKPAPTQEVPPLIARMFDDTISRTLSSVGWTVVVTDAFSMQPEKLILASEPPAGTRLSVSGTITLSLSTGGRQEINATFDTPIVLESVHLRNDRFAPGSVLELDVRWRATGRVPRAYKVAAYLLDGKSYVLVAQAEDREPRNAGAPAATTGWVNGTVVNDTYVIPIPLGTAAGTYRIALAVYQEQQPRLRVLNKGSALDVQSDSLIVRTIDVVR